MQIMECVPNFSEGRDKEKVERIASCFKNLKNLKLLDYSWDTDHNRSVITAVGQPEVLAQAMIDAVGVAVRLIDLTKHSGEHPRIGAVDVIPFIPVKDCTMDDAIKISKYVGQEIASKYNLPVYLYEYSATAAHRSNLADIRRGQFEGLAQKMQQSRWKPDFGPDKPHPTAGATVCGARKYLCAYNINLATPDINIAKAIARKIRYSSGGLPCCKAIGVYLGERDLAQVSMNITDFTVTPLVKVFDQVKLEAQDLGVGIIGSEIIGLVPKAALPENAQERLKIENFSPLKILENHLFFD